MWGWAAWEGGFQIHPSARMSFGMQDSQDSFVLNPLWALCYPTSPVRECGTSHLWMGGGTYSAAE